MKYTEPFFCIIDKIIGRYSRHFKCRIRNNLILCSQCQNRSSGSNIAPAIHHTLFRTVLFSRFIFYFPLTLFFRIFPHNLQSELKSLLSFTPRLCRIRPANRDCNAANPANPQAISVGNFRHQTSLHILDSNRNKEPNCNHKQQQRQQPEKMQRGDIDGTSGKSFSARETIRIRI